MVGGLYIMNKMHFQRSLIINPPTQPMHSLYFEDNEGNRHELSGKLIIKHIGDYDNFSRMEGMNIDGDLLSQEQIVELMLKGYIIRKNTIGNIAIFL